MERTLRLEVQAASCTLAVLSEKGRKLRDFPVETKGHALAGTCACVGKRLDACPSRRCG